jgi:hypothetical protein
VAILLRQANISDRILLIKRGYLDTEIASEIFFHFSFSLLNFTTMANHPESKQLSDGSFLIHTENGNIHTDHIHLDSDGETVLSIKSGGVSDYSVSGTRRELSDLYEEVTGEKDRFPRGYRP